MRIYFRSKQASLTLLWLGYLLLAVFALIFEVEAKTYPAFTSKDFYKYQAVAAREVILPNGIIAWLHGISKGSLVTISGNKAPEGLYSSQDGTVAFTVDGIGQLTAAITEIIPVVEQFDVAALISSEQEEDEILRRVIN
ncbi:MAG: hypothetical protein ACHQII_04610 [Bacteroidia bacterium]